MEKRKQKKILMPSQIITAFPFCYYFKLKKDESASKELGRAS